MFGLCLFGCAISNDDGAQNTRCWDLGLGPRLRCWDAADELDWWGLTLGLIMGYQLAIYEYLRHFFVALFFLQSR
jgi:hypothetical protein